MFLWLPRWTRVPKNNCQKSIEKESELTFNKRDQLNVLLSFVSGAASSALLPPQLDWLACPIPLQIPDSIIYHPIRA